MIDQDLLAAMLADQDGASADGDVWTLDGEVDVLLKGEAGAPMPLRKVRKIQVGAAYLTLETDELVWRLPYSVVMGIRGHFERPKKGNRTGFAT